MKPYVFFLLLPIVLATACTDKKLQTYTANVPLYLSYEQLREPLKVEAERDLVKPGKIYFYGDYMFINEYREGIHVVDLSDPSAPLPVAFIEIPGTVDMAIRNQVLYADSYIDLVLIDISDPEQPEELKRVEEIFEYVIPPYDYEYPLDEIDEDKGVVTGFEIREITREIRYHPHPWPIFWEYDMVAEASPGLRNSAGVSGDTYGVGGSMARFMTYDKYLYALESDYQLSSIDISNIDSPSVVHEQYLWGNVETLFISGEYLYVGTSNGMHIMSLEEPSRPAKISTYQHITACDPVVVSGNRAYVTLRSGNWCGGDQNLLEVIDISDKYDPKRIASYGMQEPYGLGIAGNLLYVCEGEHGLKVYDASDSYSITSNRIAVFPGINARDVIPLDDFLFMIGDDGFYIYDHSDPANISLLSSLPVSAE